MADELIDQSIAAQMQMSDALKPDADFNSPMATLANPELLQAALLDVPPTQLVDISQLIKKGDFATARKIIAPLLAQDNPHLETLFISGQLWQAQGEARKAAEDYRAMLNRNPALVRPRLELGLVLFQLEDYESALYHFEKVLGNKALPAQVQANVMQFVRGIRDRQGYVNLNFSIAPDTNINSGTYNREIIIDGNRYLLSDTTQQTSGLGVVINANAQRNFGLDLSYFVRGSVEWVDYKGKLADSVYAAAYSGKVFKLNTHSITLEVGAQTQTYQDHALYDGLIIRLGDSVAISPQTRLQLTLDERQFNYEPTFDYKTGAHANFTAEARHALDGVSDVSFAASLTHANAKESPYAFNELGLTAGYNRELPYGIIAGVEFAAARSEYQGLDPFFGIKRADTNLRGEINLLKRNWSWQGFAPRLTLAYVDNQSNLVLNQYQRAYGRITFSKNF